MVADDSKIQTVWQICKEMNPSPRFFNYDGTWESFTIPEGFEKPSKEVFEVRYKELYALEPGRRLRETRDNLITLTDWVLMPDVTMSEEKLEEWKTYRKALRDLPSITTPTLCEDGIRLLNVTWPTKPQ